MRGSRSLAWTRREPGHARCRLFVHNDKQVPRLFLVPQPPRPQPSTHLRQLLRSPSLLESVMAGGVALPEGVREIVIHMKDTCLLDAKTTAYLTNIPLRTVYHILAVWRKTGEAKPAPEGKQGRPRALDFGDTQVSRQTSNLCFFDRICSSSFNLSLAATICILKSFARFSRSDAGCMCRSQRYGEPCSE